MKRLLSFATLIGAFALMPLNSAVARDHCRDGRLVGYTPCGKPIYAYHQVVRRDHCGRNVWQWVTRYPSSCHCRGHHHGYDRGHCDSDRSSYRPGGWSFFFRF